MADEAFFHFNSSTSITLRDQVPRRTTTMLPKKIEAIPATPTMQVRDDTMRRSTPTRRTTQTGMVFFIHRLPKV
jgi:hypothetical protein